MDNVLLATDLSGSSYNLVECMTELKRFGVRSLILSHIIELKYTYSIPPGVQEKSDNILNEQAEILSSQRFTVISDLRSGIPWSELLDSAKAHNASLIIVGSHGRSIAGEIVLGSVTSELIEQANIPVLVMRMTNYDQERKIRICSTSVAHLFDDVLFATDFSEENMEAQKFVQDNSQFMKKLTVVHVQEPIMLEQPVDLDLQELDAIDLKRLQDMERDMRPKAQFCCDVLHGKASLELASYIECGKYSLVVLGTRGFGLSARLLLGSTSRYVIRHTKSPVLIIPKR